MAELHRETFGLNEETEIVAFSQVLSDMMSLLTGALRDRDFLRATFIESLLVGWLSDFAPLIRSRCLEPMKEMTLGQLSEMNEAVRAEQAIIVRKAITDAGGYVPAEAPNIAASPAAPSGMYL